MLCIGGINEVRPPESCTSQLQQWNKPRKRKRDACDVDDISFVKHEYGKNKRQPSSTVYDPRPSEMASTSHHEVTALTQRLRSTGEDVAILHLLPLSLPSVDSQSIDLPLLPSREREVILNEVSAQMLTTTVLDWPVFEQTNLHTNPSSCRREINEDTAIVQAMARREAVQDHCIQIRCRDKTSAQPRQSCNAASLQQSYL